MENQICLSEKYTYHSLHYSAFRSVAVLTRFGF